MKYVITISYDGSKYWGLQKLKNKLTVQGELENILTKLNESKVSVKCASRTDKGVHAISQKCHFEIEKKITPYKLKYYLNRMTSRYLYIKDCFEVTDNDFHARFSAKSKIYLYKIKIGEYSPLDVDYFYNYNKPLDISLMKKSANLIIGTHDYKAFVCGKHKTYESKIDYIKIYTKGKDIIEIEIKGKAFYTYMVRNIVSILVLTGNKKITIDTVKKMLDKKERIIEYSPAPSSGLYLKEIIY